MGSSLTGSSNSIGPESSSIGLVPERLRSSDFLYGWVGGFSLSLRL